MDIPLTYLRNVSELWMKILFGQHAVTIKTNLFNLLISLMLTSGENMLTYFLTFKFLNKFI